MTILTSMTLMLTQNWQGITLGVQRPSCTAKQSLYTKPLILKTKRLSENIDFSSIELVPHSSQGISDLQILAHKHGIRKNSRKNLFELYETSFYNHIHNFGKPTPCETPLGNTPLPKTNLRDLSVQFSQSQTKRLNIKLRITLGCECLNKSFTTVQNMFSRH